MTITTYSSELLQQIANNTWQESMLDVSEQYLDDEKLENLCNALKQNHHIKTLCISNSNMTTRGACAIANCAQLTKLVADYSGIDDSIAKVLAQSSTITELILDHNNIGNAGMRALLQNKVLTTLDVSYNSFFTDKSMADLAANTTLRVLHINGTNIGKQGLAIIAKSKTISKLYAHCVRFDEADAQLFLGNNALVALEVEDSKVDPKKIQALRDKIKRNNQAQENWLRVAPLIAFVRANAQHPLRTSYLALAPGIATLAEEKHHDEKSASVNLSKFFDTQFFKSSTVKKSNSDLPTVAVKSMTNINGHPSKTTLEWLRHQLLPIIHFSF